MELEKSKELLTWRRLQTYSRKGEVFETKNWYCVCLFTLLEAFQIFVQIYLQFSGANSDSKWDANPRKPQIALH